MDENIETNTELDEESTASRRLRRRRDDYVTFRFRRTRFLTAAFITTFGLGLFVGYSIWGGHVNSSQTANDAQNTSRFDVPILDSDPAFGPEDAPITFIEFSDFECPYCRQHFLEVYPRLLEKYGDQIRYVYKDFPLTSIHANAVPAAEAALCANEQGSFWEYHDLLFTMRLDLGSETYLTYAEELGLDLDTFGTCVDERRYADEVRGDYDFAANLGIRSTPTFFINGLVVQGALPYEEFIKIIDAELAGLN